VNEYASLWSLRTNMLEKIREGSQGLWAMVILGLVILSFMFAGIGSYINSPSSSAVASVNGEDISQVALEKAYQSQRQRMESQYGEAFATLASDATYLKQFRAGILDNLINEKLLDQAAKKLGLRISDEQLKAEIVAMPAFQVDGKFSNEYYQAVLRQAGYQPNTFRDTMRQDLTRQQLSRALFASEFALAGETQDALNLQQQARDLRYLIIPSSSFADQIVLTEEEITSYYQANLSQFDTLEKVSVDYVELKVADLLPNIEVTAEQLQEYYQQNLASYRSEEQRRVSHILIEFGDDEATAKNSAEDVLAKLRAGEDFTQLAKQYSTDSFSAENGGDLDWFGKGAMDPVFEDAAYALTQEGDVSELVKSSFGFHIIKLTGIKAEQVTPFAELVEEITAKVKTEKATEEFYEMHQQMAARAFEVPDSLEEVAAVVNHPIKHTEMFDRENAPSPLNAKAISEAFSDVLIDEKVNSEVIELADDHILVLRVSGHEAERTKPLDEVKATVTELLTAQKSQAAAKAWAQEIKLSLDNAEDVTAKLEEKTLAWQEQSAVSRAGNLLDPAIVENLFKLAVVDKQDKAVTELTDGNIGLIQLLKVTQADPMDPIQLSGIQRRLGSSRGQLMLADFVESLKAEADITKHAL
jgi:peptidyl-prolyl cis-trans isomerase D